MANASEAAGIVVADPPEMPNGDERQSSEEREAAAEDGDANVEVVDDAELPKGMARLPYLGLSTVAKEVKALKERKAAAKDAQKKAATDLRNATRREKRIREKAAKLDNNDLMEVFKMRQEAQAKAVAKTKAKAKAAAKQAAA